MKRHITESMGMGISKRNPQKIRHTKVCRHGLKRVAP